MTGLSSVLTSTDSGYLLSMADGHTGDFPIVPFDLLLNAAWIASFNGGPASMFEKTILPNGLASLSLLLLAIYVWMNGRRITDAGGVSPLAFSPLTRRRKGLGSSAFDLERLRGAVPFRGWPRVSDDLVGQLPSQPDSVTGFFKARDELCRGGNCIMEIDVICVALDGEERSYTFDQFIESTKAVELARKLKITQVT